jgi:DNA-binding transcriptional regulator YhcF (GntR family)
VPTLITDRYRRPASSSAVIAARIRPAVAAEEVEPGYSLPSIR